MRGFTLVEIAVTIGIFSVIIAITAPVALDSYLNYLLTAEMRNIVSLIRRAENLSLANDGYASHGISFQSNRYVIFRGNSYAARNITLDEISPRTEIINISGGKEIVFLPISGMPNSTITLSLNNNL